MRIAAWLISLLLVGPAAAQPSVRVRAETRIELRTEQRAGTRSIVGVLRDDLGTPLAGQSVEVRFRAARSESSWEVHRTQTDEGGRFVLPGTMDAETYHLMVRFEGSADYERISVHREMHVDRTDVRLQVDIDGGPSLDLDRLEHTVMVTATSHADLNGLRIEVLSELDRVLALGSTDMRGQARIRLESALLGPPGPGRLKVRSAADDERAQAQTEVPIIRYRNTALTLAGPDDSLVPDAEVLLRGELRDRGGPLQGRAVGIFADGVHLATVLTNADGAFAATVRAPSTEGTVRTVARFDSDSPGRGGSESPPVELTIEAPTSLGSLWLLVPIGICLLLLAFAARRSPEPIRQRKIQPGIVAAKRQARSADRYDIAGQIFDTRDDEPVGDAMVTLVSSSAEAVPVAVGRDGRFRIETMKAGTWTLRVEARGYEPAEGTLEVPHHGEWSDLRVRVRSLRAIAMNAFRRLAIRLLPKRRYWPIWTNREVLAQSRLRDATKEPLAKLTDHVETAYYAEGPPSQSDLDAIEELAQQASAAREADRTMNDT